MKQYYTISYTTTCSIFYKLCYVCTSSSKVLTTLNIMLHPHVSFSDNHKHHPITHLPEGLLCFENVGASTCDKTVFSLLSAHVSILSQGPVNGLK